MVIVLPAKDVVMGKTLAWAGHLGKKYLMKKNVGLFLFIGILRRKSGDRPRKMYRFPP